MEYFKTEIVLHKEFLEKEGADKSIRLIHTNDCDVKSIYPGGKYFVVKIHGFSEPFYCGDFLEAVNKFNKLGEPC